MNDLAYRGTVRINNLYINSSYNKSISSSAKHKYHSIKWHQLPVSAARFMLFNFYGMKVYKNTDYYDFIKVGDNLNTDLEPLRFFCTIHKIFYN